MCIRDSPLPARLAPGQAPISAPITIQRDHIPFSPQPLLDALSSPTVALQSCPWVWYPEGNPAAAAPPGRCYFRGQPFTLPTDRPIKAAVFTGTADNSFILYVNGKDVGHGDDSAEGWRNPAQLQVAPLLHAGPNLLAIAATNAQSTGGANPAGLIGQLTVTFEQGDPLTVRIDKTWRVARDAASNWTTPEFDDQAWTSAKEIARFGDAPWGQLNAQLTLSPVKADPFVGHCEIPASADLALSRVYLEMDSLTPEDAARITINDQYAGGFIGHPLRLDVSAYVRPGANSIRIEPFAPPTARLVIYPR